jgi:hypothetical protein
MSDGTAADVGAAGALTLIVRPYSPRSKKGHSGRWILVAACLLAFVWVVSHCSHSLNSDGAVPVTIDNPTTAPATTDNPADAGIVYGRAHAADVCSVLTAYPTVGGITGIAQAITQRDGLSPYAAGEAIGEAIYTNCPRFLPLMQSFAHMGSTAT